MLQIKNIRKSYTTGELTQTALDGVSFNLRDSEFVAVLGQSGSGKTTLLNIIGGLDRYDSGDVVINGISTKKYKDRDWDSYRNHTVGFIFQSYNLIAHQSILSNVELALTISGVSRGERRRRAKKALEDVGLGGQLHKKPNQMSGGQMQRVAIARALVNDPDILLADEPTGALDSETSIQVMELLKEVAQERLVIMVTHNPEVADIYASRIIRLHDGRIVGDSDPYAVDESGLAAPAHKNMGKASMSFGTALSLSFNNLRTKKGRTLMTAVAGSIGIIGIALIMSLSTGVNSYIEDIQKDTMASYPITIDAQSIDLGSIIHERRQARRSDAGHGFDAVYSNSSDMKIASSAMTSVKTNDLTDFKRYLDDPNGAMNRYLGENGVVYSYDVKFDAYAYDPDGTLVNTDGSTLGVQSGAVINGVPVGAGIPSSGGIIGSSGSFEELMPGQGGTLISPVITDNYDILYGAWPQSYDEVILVLDGSNELPATTLYELGLLPSSEYTDAMERIKSGEEVEFSEREWNYADICRQTFMMVPECDYYVEGGDGLFRDISGDAEAVQGLIAGAAELKISGVVRPAENTGYALISGAIGYTRELTEHVIARTNASPAVTAQEANPDVNIVSGFTFNQKDDAAKLADTKTYLSSLGISEKAAVCKGIFGSPAMQSGDPEAAARMANASEIELAAMLDHYLLDPDAYVLLAIYDGHISAGSYIDNMLAFGAVSPDAPSSINIFADTFEDKDALSAGIDDYNASADAEHQIAYTDYVGLLMSSVTTIIDVISYVLIAFVAVSLVVSSIMIGIITFISVLERTKEIGILRAIGASKRNVSQVFNAETFIIGLLSGLIGVGITLVLLIPGNAIIHAVIGTQSINAVLPITSSLLLVALSLLLTLIAGLIPSRAAAKKDPVVALRSE
ncbi:MAG: ABC transporter ATP-binding protein/permease [Oscillospiraceae bacterium]|nr:ABC transporter ATP-binding protein/permease [Oscillospiraceae bacterium]